MQRRPAPPARRPLTTWLVSLFPVHRLRQIRLHSTSIPDIDYERNLLQGASFMRVSRAQAEQNRQTVIDVASQLFREHGFDGIGLKDVMAAAGLTQGAFYKQFASKDDLAAQASKRALESISGQWSAAVESNPKDPLGAVAAR